MKNIYLKLKINLLACAILVLATSAPAFAQRTAIKADDKKESIVITTGSKTWTHSSKSGQKSFNIEYKGTIDVTDDDKDIKSISPGGYIEISKTTFGSKREILIESTSGGSLRREYYEGRQKTAWEPAGRKWLAEILPEIVRSTGIAAESRVKRFYNQGGVDAVLNEVLKLEGDYVVAIYGKLLLKNEQLSNNDLKKAINGLSEEMSSDYYLAEILRDNSERFLKNDDTAETYFEAATKIGSDYYATVVLKSALESHKPSAASLAKIMNASKQVGSDYYQATLLMKILELDDLDEKTIAEVIKSTKDVDSDYYQAQVLSKAMGVDGLSGESFSDLLDAVSDVSSDYYMATVFSKLAENPLDEIVVVKMVELVNDKMSSEYYASTVLSKLMKEQELSSESMDKIAAEIGQLGSGHYATSVIKAVAKNDNLTKKSLLSLIAAIGQISSDYYASSSLEALAPQVKRSDTEVKEAYRLAAKKINSDTYYGRAMRAID